MLAGVGLELGAINADRVNLAQTQMLGQLQHAHKRCLERLLVGGAKRADRRQIHRCLAVQVDSAGQQNAGILVGRTTPFNVQNFLRNIRSLAKRRPPFV
jgi:hypothetical protein